MLSYPSFVHRLLVKIDQTVNCTFSDFQTRKMRQEVISNEETHEDPVINCSLEVIREREIWHREISLKIFSQNTQAHKYVLLFLVHLKCDVLGTNFN